MNKISFVVAAFLLLCGYCVSAQDIDKGTADSLSKAYSERYDVLVSRLGANGVGVETLLDNWEQVDPDNIKMIIGKYSYYIAKASTTVVVSNQDKKYLGNNPTFSLKDSLGNNVNYFEEVVYDDSLYTIAIKNIDRAIKVAPNDFNPIFLKGAALLSYEKGSPDMALNYLESLVDRYYANLSADWSYDGQSVSKSFFVNAMQEYCYAFYNIGSPRSYKAFKELSEKMLTKEPTETIFLSNIGSYYLVAEQNTKKALKYYNDVLKISPQDYTAAKNCVLICRRDKNVKLEKKYLPILIAATPDEAERVQAEARLKSI